MIQLSLYSRALAQKAWRRLGLTGKGGAAALGALRTTVQPDEFRVLLLRQP
jgi:hypothetical protein